MTFVQVIGDPDKISSFIGSIVAAGNAVRVFIQTKNHSTYLLGFAPTGPVVNNYILMESGSFLLLESGSKIIL